MSVVQLVSQFGNVIVLTALSLSLAIWIGRHVSARACGLWLACVVAVTGTIGAVKILFSGCLVAPWDVHSPSGHTGYSTIAYGGLAVVLTAAERRSWVRLLIPLVVGGWIVAIGLSRIILHAHTPHEVFVGWTLGGAAVLVFAQFYRASRGPTISFALPALGVVLFIALNPWMHYTAENGIHWFGGWLARNTQVCQTLGLR